MCLHNCLHTGVLLYRWLHTFLHTYLHIWDIGTRKGKIFNNRHFLFKVRSRCVPDFFFKLLAVRFIWAIFCCEIIKPPDYFKTDLNAPKHLI